MKGQRKYYWEEHEWGYHKIAREGKTAWNEIHGGAGFDNFASRAFLERALPMLPSDLAQTRVLEYGCGTGPGACFLAARGLRVDGIDLVPRAIDLARRFAAERGLDVRYEVRDLCALGELPPGGEPPYHLIVDSYCLQSIVTDGDREKLFAAVRSRLKPSGYYLISTAMYQPGREYEKGYRYDERTGIVYGPVWDDPATYESAVQIAGTWYQPNRRHLKPDALASELEQAGFRVLWQGGRLGGDVICVRSDGSARLRQQEAASTK